MHKENLKHHIGLLLSVGKGQTCRETPRAGGKNQWSFELNNSQIFHFWPPRMESPQFILQDVYSSESPEGPICMYVCICVYSDIYILLHIIYMHYIYDDILCIYLCIFIQICVYKLYMYMSILRYLYLSVSISLFWYPYWYRYRYWERKERENSYLLDIDTWYRYRYT